MLANSWPKRPELVQNPAKDGPLLQQTVMSLKRLMNRDHSRKRPRRELLPQLQSMHAKPRLGQDDLRLQAQKLDLRLLKLSKCRVYLANNDPLPWPPRMQKLGDSLEFSSTERLER